VARQPSMSPQGPDCGWWQWSDAGASAATPAAGGGQSCAGRATAGRGSHASARATSVSAAPVRRVRLVRCSMRITIASGAAPGKHPAGVKEHSPASNAAAPSPRGLPRGTVRRYVLCGSVSGRERAGRERSGGDAAVGHRTARGPAPSLVPVAAIPGGPSLLLDGRDHSAAVVRTAVVRTAFRHRPAGVRTTLTGRTRHVRSGSRRLLVCRTLSKSHALSRPEGGGPADGLRRGTSATGAGSSQQFPL